MQPAIDNGGYSLRPDGNWRRRDDFVVWTSPSTAMEVRFQLFTISRLALEGQLPGAAIRAGEGILLGRRMPGTIIVEEYAPPGRDQQRAVRNDRRSTRPGERAVGWYQSVAVAEFPNEQAAAEICSRYAPRGRQVLLFLRADWVEGTVAAAYMALDGAIVGRSPVLALDSGPELDAELPEPESAEIPVSEAEEDPPAGGVLVSAPQQVRIPSRPAHDYDPAPRPVRLSRPQPRRAWLPWTIGSVAIALALSSALLQYRTVSLLRSDDAGSRSSLGLNTTRDGGQLRLTWNSRNPAVATASSGRLTILDGPIKKDLDLNPNELQNGSVVYTPVTSDLSVRLEVIDGQHGRSVSETVRLLAGPWPDTGAARLNAWDMAGAPPVAALPVPQRRIRDLPAPAAAPPGPSRPPAAATVHEPVVVMPAAAAPQAVAAAQPSAVVPAAPAPPDVTQSSPTVVVSESRVAPMPEPVQETAPAPAAQEPKAQPPVAPSAPPAASAPPLTSRVEQAVLLEKVEPVFPQEARNRRQTATVVVRGVIGKDGRMRSVRALEGPHLFRLAAENAVRLWRYRPTLLNGQPVENEIVVNIRFGVQ